MKRRCVSLKFIGIIAPGDKRINTYSKLHFIKNGKPDFLFNEKHLVCFAVAYDNQNYNKIFRKNSVSAAVCAAGAILPQKPEVHIADGTEFFKKHMLYFIAKAFKLYALNSETASVCFSDDEFSENTVNVICQSSRLFRYITLQTENPEKAEAAAKRLFCEYGVSAGIIGENETVPCDIFVTVNGGRCFVPCNAAAAIGAGCSVPLPPEYSISLPGNIPFFVPPLALAEALCYINY